MSRLTHEIGLTHDSQARYLSRVDNGNMANLTDTLISLVPVVVGFVLGVGFQVLRDGRSNRHARMGLAAALACEVEAIRAIAVHSNDLDRPDVEASRDILDKGGSQIRAIELRGVDYPTTVFQSNVKSLRVLGEEQMLQLTELYRWVDYTHRKKRQNLAAKADYTQISLSLAAHGGGPTTLEEGMLRNAGMLSIASAEQYLRNQSELIELAKPLVGKLEGIGKVPVAGKVKVSLGEPTRTSVHVP